jgi:hypothetical protein
MQRSPFFDRSLKQFIRHFYGVASERKLAGFSLDEYREFSERRLCEL